MCVEKKQVAQLLQSRGVQATTQRFEIAALILDRPQHLSADEVLRRLHAIGARVHDLPITPEKVVDALKAVES